MDLIYFFLGLLAFAFLAKAFSGVDSCDCDDDVNDRPMRKIRMVSSIYFEDDEEFLVGDEAFVMADEDPYDDYVTAYIDVDDWDGYKLPRNSFIYVD